MKLHDAHLLMGAVLMLATTMTIALTLDWTSGVPRSGLVGLALWPAAPIALATFVGWMFRKSRRALIACMLGLVITFAVMVALFIYSFVLHPDPQGGLILLFGPLYAIFAFVPFCVTSLALYFRRPRRTHTQSA